MKAEATSAFESTLLPLATERGAGQDGDIEDGPPAPSLAALGPVRGHPQGPNPGPALDPPQGQGPILDLHPGRGSVPGVLRAAPAAPLAPAPALRLHANATLTEAHAPHPGAVPARAPARLGIRSVRGGPGTAAQVTCA